MTEGIRKASNRVRKAGKPARQGKGSHSVLQRVLGRLIASVQIADERMGFVQVSAVCQAGGSAACHPWAQPDHNAPVNAHGIALRHAHGQSDPLPPTPHLALGALGAIFPPLFTAQVLVHNLYINQRSKTWRMR
jgi:hypothetical protein